MLSAWGFHVVVFSLLLAALWISRQYSQVSIFTSAVSVFGYLCIHVWFESAREPVTMSWYPADSVLLLSGPLWGWLFHLSSHNTRLCIMILVVMVTHGLAVLTTVHWEDLSSMQTGWIRAEIVVILAALDLGVATICYMDWIYRVVFFLSDYALVSSDTQVLEIEPVVIVPTSDSTPQRICGLSFMTCGPLTVPHEGLYPSVDIPEMTPESSASSSSSSPTNSTDMTINTNKRYSLLSIRIKSWFPIRHIAHLASLCAIALILLRMADSILLYQQKPMELIHQGVHVLAAGLNLLHLMVHT